MSIGAIKQSVEAAYLAGFNASGEGYNDEYPFGDKMQDPAENRVWKKDRDNYVSQAIADLEKQEHGSPEDMYVGMHKHLNCPHCGGSGHIDDVAEKQDPVAWPSTPDQISDFIGGSYVWREHKTSDVEPHEDDKYCLTAHDLLEAFSNWIDTQPQPKRDPLTDEQKDIINFLLGASDIDDVWFGDKHPTEKGQFWWRNRLRKAFQDADHNIKEPT